MSSQHNLDTLKLTRRELLKAAGAVAISAGAASVLSQPLLVPFLKR